MARETRTKEIDGHTWQLKMLGSKRGMKLFTRLGAVLSPVMTKLAAAQNEQDMAMVADAAQQLFAKLDEKEMEHFIDELLLAGEIEKDDKPIFKAMAFEDELAGAALTIFKLLWFAVELNYGDFADAVRGWVATRAAAASPSEASTT